MSSAWIQTLTAVGVILVGLLTFYGGRYAARQSSKSVDRQVDVEEWKAILGALRAEVKRLTERIEAIEADGKAREIRYNALIRFVRELLAWIHREHPKGDEPPVPATFVGELT